MQFRLTMIGVLALTGTLTGAPSAVAGCGGVQHRSAVDPPRAYGRPALVIGDSVVLGALGPITAAGFEIDTRGCRPWSEGLRVIRQRKANGTLPRIVFVALGSNGGVSGSQLQQASALLGRDRVLGVVTPRGHGGSAGNAPMLMRRYAQRHPGRVVLADWVTASAGHGSYFSGDGLHLGAPGARALATLLRDARRRVSPQLCAS